MGAEERALFAWVKSIYICLVLRHICQTYNRLPSEISNCENVITVEFMRV